MTYVIKHVLPNGETAGYHTDSGCLVTSTVEIAKRYENRTDEEVAEQLQIVRENFEYVWNLRTSENGGGPNYRNLPRWQGCSLEQIQTVIEIIT